MAVKRNILANYLGAGWTALMTIAFIPLYIHYLGVEAYALIGVFAMLQGWLLMLDLGMAPALSREFARFDRRTGDPQSLRDLLRSVEMAILALALCIALAMFLASEWIASWWLSPESLPIPVVVQSISLMGIAVAMRFMENVYRSTLIGLQRQVSLNAVNASIATLRSTGAVAVLAFAQPTLEAFFVWQCVVSFLSLLWLGGCAYKAAPKSARKGRFSPSVLKGLLRFAAGAMAITFLSLLLTNVDKVLLSHLLELELFGYYAFAVIVANTPLGLVAPVAQAVYPRFAELMKSNGESALAHVYHSATQLVVVFLGTATLVLVLFGREILGLWTRSSSLVDSAYPLVVLLALGSLVNGLMTIPYYLQLAAGWTSLLVRVNLLALALVMPVLLLVVPAYGAIGAGWVWLGLNAALMAVLVPCMHRRLLPGEEWRWLVRGVGFPLLAGAAVAAMLRQLHSLLTPPPFGELLILAASAALIAVTIALAAPLSRQRVLHFLVRRPSAIP